MIDSNLWVRWVPQTVKFIPHILEYYINWHKNSEISHKNKKWGLLLRKILEALSLHPLTATISVSWGADDPRTIRHRPHLAQHGPTEPWVCNPPRFPFPEFITSGLEKRAVLGSKERWGAGSSHVGKALRMRGLYTIHKHWVSTWFYPSVWHQNVLPSGKDWLGLCPDICRHEGLTKERR